MENYIYLNGQKIELTPEQVALIKGESETVELGKIPVGKIANIGGLEFVVLEHAKETTALILKGLWGENVLFGKDNNFKGSRVDKICKEVASRLEELVGPKNIVEHTVDLTSDDGLKDYGITKRKVSLLTTELYRRYVNILDMHKPDSWWWLATPYSTPSHNHSSWAKCVSPGGYLDYDSYFNDYGVRPFCILKSNIFVSK